MKFINLKCDVSFQVWQIILIFSCKLMVFLLLPLGKKRHFTNYYGAGQRHLCLLASVLAWHIGPLTQMPEEGKEGGWQHSFDAIQDLWKFTQVQVAGVFQTGAQIKLGHLEEFSLTRFLNKIFFKYPCGSIISRGDFGSIFTIWFSQWGSSAYFFFKESNLALKAIPDNCLFSKIEQKSILEVFTFSPVLNSICHNGCCERIFE